MAASPVATVAIGQSLPSGPIRSPRMAVVFMFRTDPPDASRTEADVVEITHPALDSFRIAGGSKNPSWCYIVRLPIRSV